MSVMAKCCLGGIIGAFKEVGNNSPGCVILKYKDWRQLNSKLPPQLISELRRAQ